MFDAFCVSGLTGFGTTTSSAPSLGGGLTTGFGAAGVLGTSAFGQQPTTGISLYQIDDNYKI